MIYDVNELDLIKSITRTEAKAVHKDLPPGGEWKTIKGHHIYLKDGKILAGSIPGVTKAKKMTKQQMTEHQATIDAEGKKKNAKKPKAPAKGTKSGAVSKPASTKPAAPAKSTTKGGQSGAKKGTSVPKVEKPKEKTDASKKTTSKTKAPAKPAKPKGAGKLVPAAGAKKGTSEGTKAPKKPKDIRHEAQKNRDLAYDTGEKFGGARKDEFIAGFKAKPTIQSLAELEKMGGAVAEKMVTKANLMPSFDAQKEFDNGVDLQSSVLKKLIFDRVAPKPDPSNPQTRREYLNAMNKLHRHLAGIKDWDNMKNAIRELSDYARDTSTKTLESRASSIKYYNQQATGTNSWGGKVSPEDQAKGKERAKEFEGKLAEGFEKKRAFNFEALGDKLNNFFTDWDSRERTMKSVQKVAKDGWEAYLGKKSQPKAPKERGAENKKWQRATVSEYLRKGGKPVTMNKPEELMKTFGVRGVEFGNWVNDDSGKYHLQRCAEAFHDLADIVGIDPKDISLNGRLGIAFGARGTGTALAHYEPDRKVINMTKYGGAGSLAHEWGHAMDNILHQYSEGGRDSLGLASQGQMGEHDPKLKALYHNLMDAINKPAPGEQGGTHQVILDSEAKSLSKYYPEMRRQVNSGMKPEDVYQHWTSKINDKYDRYVANAKGNYLRSAADKEKAVKGYETQRKKELNAIGHHLAHELRLKQNEGRYGGDHYKGHIEVSTGKSKFATNSDMMDSKGKEYWGSNEEMFARVFESYIQDKLEKAKRKNNYLVHGTDEGSVRQDGAPYPEGKERQHMFKALENLLTYVSKEKALKKALMLEILAGGSGDMTEEIRKSTTYAEAFHSVLKRKLGQSTGIPTKRSAYNVANPDECIYIPTNRLRTVYQTEQATNWDKVEENRKRMEAGENLEPVSIGFDYDVHDGHHRIEAAKKCGHEHIPCVVKGGNELERKRAVDAYREVWKSIITDPVNPYNDAFESDAPYMFRGIGQKELDFIRKNGFIQTRGKGNDEDKDVKTCFSNLYSQAAGYARSNYDLYNEPHAYVIALPKQEAYEDETGEIAIPGRISSAEMMVIPIPKEVDPHG